MAFDDNNSSNQFADSDDERDETKIKKKKKAKDGDNFDSSLCFKAGRNSNTSLYYVDYNAAKNGNGLNLDEKNELYANLANAHAERDAITATIKQLETETEKLLSEPKNDEATVFLEAEESALVQIKEELETARKYQVNEKDKVQLKRKVETMTAEWRKRRRICMDFLISMEENTDGTLNLKKCLAGDGPIDIDSDEVVAKNAIAFGKKKRTKNGISKQYIHSKSNPTSKSDILADESFVAVVLDSKGCVERIFVED